MLTLILGTDWVANRAKVFDMIAEDVHNQFGKRILMVPELISHDTERRLCELCGDTASRFAEVLSFPRLLNRVAAFSGCMPCECIDNGGRVVAMASAARQLHSVLKAYASVETRPEFLTDLVDAVDEFKRCCITSEDLRSAASKTEGSLAQKLEELSLLLDAYDGLCSHGKRDPRDQMNWLLEKLEEGTFAEEHVFFVDGFPDFTRQHMMILEHLILMSPRVIISLNCDIPGSRNMAFEKAGNTALEILNFARRSGVHTDTVFVSPRKTSLSAVIERIFQGPTDANLSAERLALYRTESISQECTIAAEKILSLVRSGLRYRDIGIVCADIAAYKNSVNMILRRCGIPVYLSGTDSILDKSVITTVLAAIDAALGGFERRDVIRYLKSTLSPLELDICDKLENYAILWGINGSKWLTDWVNHPRGLGEPFTENDYEYLDELNQARALALKPLVKLREGFRKATILKDQILVLYQYLEDISLSERLSRIADELDRIGDNRSAQILNQLWEILLNALEQLYDVLGNTVWETETFTRLISLLLSQYDVGTIPPVLDSVMVGPVSAMRCQQLKHVIVLGALEGALPGYGGATGVLNDQERENLRRLGVHLTGGALEGLRNEFAEIYAVFASATDSITVTCPSGQPSFIFRRLSTMSEGVRGAEMLLGAALADKTEASAYLARWNAGEEAAVLGISEEYNEMLRKKYHTLGSVSAENIQGLYGKRLRLSASQIDKLADCRLSYFLKYGLRAKERKPISIDPAEFGTYVHWVLENTVRKIMELGGFKEVSREETLTIAGEYSDIYAEERFGQLNTDRIVYLFKRNRQELTMIVSELWDELHHCAFFPAAFELEFGEKGSLPAIELPSNSLDAQLSGFVDRVDIWKHNDHSYYRVVDYKTGKKDFDYCDVFNGLGLQMLLYLFALENGDLEAMGKEAIAAGVQYFPARVPYVTAEGSLTEEEADAIRSKSWKRHGLLLSDEMVLDAMSGDRDINRLPFTKKKDGTISGDLADTKQLRILKDYLFQLLGRMVDDIASGSVAPNPYTRGNSHDACSFCPYGSVCHKNDVEGRRNYKTMTPQRFWDEITKEMKNHG